MATTHIEDVSSSFSSDNDDDDELVKEDCTTQKFRIRLHAANLPRKRGSWGKAAPPDTFAVISSMPNNNNNIAGGSSSQTNSPLRPASISARGVSNASSVSNTASSSRIWGKTEVVYSSQNPQWTSTVTIDYVSGSATYFYVHLFQHSPQQADRHMESYGTALFHVRDLLSTKHRTRAKRLRSGGCVFCRLEPVRHQSNLSRMVQLTLQASDLMLPGQHRRSGSSNNNSNTTTTNSNSTNKKLALASLTTKIRPASKLPDTVLEIAKRASTSSSTWMVVYRSEPVRASLDPNYETVTLDLETLCGADIHRHLRFSVYAVHNKKKRSLIGITETTLKHLLGTTTTQDIGLLNVSDGSFKNDNDNDDNYDHYHHSGNDGVLELLLQRNSTKLKEVGRLRLTRAAILDDDGSSLSFRTEPSERATTTATATSERNGIVDLASLPVMVPVPTRSFSYYMENGCQIDFCVAIDFTSSNGDPASESSHHHLGDNTLNDYEETISAIGQALGRYSESQEYAVWGFGAKFGGVVRHIFQCGPAATVHGVDGILAAYQTVFQSDLIMSGPTVFLQTIQAAASRAKRHHDNMRGEHPRYTVLLIITDDGIMDEFEETRRRLDVYSTMPLSVVFVGVGRSDFGLLEQLCRSSNDGSTTRCITTFVEFRKHQHDPAALGEAALRNIPSQLCEYMQRQGI